MGDRAYYLGCIMGFGVKTLISVCIIIIVISIAIKILRNSNIKEII